MEKENGGEEIINTLRYKFKISFFISFGLFLIGIFGLLFTHNMNFFPLFLISGIIFISLYFVFNSAPISIKISSKEIYFSYPNKVERILFEEIENIVYEFVKTNFSSKSTLTWAIVKKDGKIKELSFLDKNIISKIQYKFEEYLENTKKERKGIKEIIPIAKMEKIKKYVKIGEEDITTKLFVIGSGIMLLLLVLFLILILIDIKFGEYFFYIYLSGSAIFFVLYFPIAYWYRKKIRESKRIFRNQKF